MKETPWLDNRHSVFGKVVSGQEVADNITKVEKLPGDKPKTDVVLTSLQILRKGKAAEQFDGLAAFNEAKEAQAKAEEAKKEEARKKLEEAMKDAEVTASGLGIIFQEKGNGVKPRWARWWRCIMQAICWMAPCSTPRSRASPRKKASTIQVANPMHPSLFLTAHRLR